MRDQKRMARLMGTKRSPIAAQSTDVGQAPDDAVSMTRDARIGCPGVVRHCPDSRSHFQSCNAQVSTPSTILPVLVLSLIHI